jgi:heparan-alpha-glucosaminide N-acetyltransferase
MSYSNAKGTAPGANSTHTESLHHNLSSFASEHPAQAVNQRGASTPARSSSDQDGAEMPLLPSSQTQKSKRIESLDVFRGFTMVGMLLVDNQGDFDYVYHQLSEDFWNGFRFCNIMFPCFLFIMGVAIPLSLQKHQFCATSVVFARVARRTVLLFAIGLLLNWAGANFHSEFRIMGVLQRIALCYGTLAPLFLVSSASTQRLVVLACLILYAALVYGLDVPGCGSGSTSEDCNAIRYVDLKILTADHMILPTDPEGIVSTLTAIFTTAAGVEAGRIIRHYKNARRSLAAQLLVACVCIPLGYVLSFAIPINKKIWSISFAVAASGYAYLQLLVFFVLLELDDVQWIGPGSVVRRISKFVTRPLVWLGSNPLLIFVLMVWLEIILLDWSDAWSSVWDWYYPHISSNPQFASLLVSLTHAVVWTAFAGILFRQRWFVKL